MIRRFIEHLKMNKKYWLRPMIFAFILFGLVAVLSQGQIVPFLYTIFE